MQLFWTVPVGDIAQASTPEEIKNSFFQVSEALTHGKNILLYPSGQIYRQGFEVIRGKQFAYQVIRNIPEETKIIGIRSHGLWGSMWGKWWDNGETTMTKVFLFSIWFFLANFAFFLPKRIVEVEIQDITNTAKQKTQEGINELNNFLEVFYNEKGQESLKYIQHYFYFNDVKNHKIPAKITGSLADLSEKSDFDISQISKTIKNDIKSKIASIKKLPLEKVSDEANFVIDLFFDSLDLAEIKSYIQAKYQGASNPPITDLKFVSDIYAMAVGQSKTVEILKECSWGEVKEKTTKLSDILTSRYEDGESILSLWKKEFQTNQNEVFFWDNIMGNQTKKDFLIKAYLIKDIIQKIPWDYIGVMLPSLGSSSLIIAAIYLAGKTPVMLNWTLGKEAFNHCVGFSQIKAILTASSFYEKVKQDFLEEYKKWGTFLFLEYLLKEVSLLQKLRALVKSKLFFIPKQREEAVLLFTSWSESLPKAVPLTHTNLISDIIGSLSLFPLTKSERLLCFLPPFHSFGFTINTIMPLITGLQSVYTPNPNDAKTLLETIQQTEPTAITSTPTFLKMMLGLANDIDLKSIKYVVTGAEKCGEEVFNLFKQKAPQGLIIEGYGITECSPVISLNPVNNPKAGTVGKVLPHLDIQIIDINSKEKLQIGEQGMIYIAGSSVFSGYLDKKLDSPFEKIGEQLYYKTGDLWYIDTEGYITITGRLKRFVKIAGEMISLPFIEGILLEKYGSPDSHQIAVEALEKEGIVKIVLFSKTPQNLEEVNAYLREKWASNLIKIDAVQTISEIPILWTGKIDYKELKKYIQ